MRKNKAGWKQNGYTMMALDDDMTITSALQAYFEASGYQVDIESDPLRALARMKEKHYDILLLDFLMQPLCGDEVVKRLRAFDRDIFIILLTGHRELAPPMNAMHEMDIQGYYEKSDRFDQLELLVESCVKAIQQMRIIRDYRDGLSRIISASAFLHRLSPVGEIIQEALEHGKTLAGTGGLFLFVDPTRAVGENGRAPLNLDEGLYRGYGRYDVSGETFSRSILPGLRGAIEETVRRGRVQALKGFLIAPLMNGEGVAFGVLVVDALCGASDELSRLLEMYARQTASALSNAVLYEMVEAKNRTITEAYQRLNDTYLETVSALRLLVDAKDIYTRGHSDRVAYYAQRLAEAVGLDEAIRERVRVAGLFHDVGKVGTSEDILTKPDRLTKEEFDKIQEHPALGARILSPMAMFKDIPCIILSHHERIDGKGYPRGLSGQEIPIEARIIAIADAFDAMTSNRHYRESLGYEKAVAEIQNGMGTQFDKDLAKAFLRLLKAEYGQMRRELNWTYDEREKKEGGAT